MAPQNVGAEGILARRRYDEHERHGKAEEHRGRGPDGHVRIEYIEGRRVLRVSAGEGDGPVEVADPPDRRAGDRPAGLRTSCPSASLRRPARPAPGRRRRPRRLLRVRGRRAGRLPGCPSHSDRRGGLGSWSPSTAAGGRPWWRGSAGPRRRMAGAGSSVSAWWPRTAATPPAGPPAATCGPCASTELLSSRGEEQRRQRRREPARRHWE